MTAKELHIIPSPIFGQRMGFISTLIAKRLTTNFSLNRLAQNNMPETQKDSSQNKLLLAIIGLLAIIILFLLGWKITKVQFFGVELAPPATSTSIPTLTPQAPPSSIPQQVEQQPIVTQPFVPTSLSMPIETMNLQELANLFGVSKNRIIRTASTKIEILDYPLKSEYEQDEQGYVIKGGQRVTDDVDYLMNIDTGVWQNFLGSINWHIPTIETTGFCKIKIWAGGKSGQWSYTLRYAQSGDDSIYIESAPRAWIDCEQNPNENWAFESAQNAQGADNGIYYWNDTTSQWVKVH